jgi:predicted Ser/Thr protein kinase
MRGSSPQSLRMVGSRPVVSCPTEEDLLGYLAPKMSERRRGDLEAHLSACALCRKTVALLARLDHGDDRAASTFRSAWPIVWSGPQLRVGDRVGRYRIVGALGEGAIGVVYAAYDDELKRKVAVKLLRSDRGELTRLRREARALARAAHPNVVTVYEVGDDQGLVFVCMELVEGQTLTAWLEHTRSFPEVLGVFVQAGHALAAAHDVGLIHRDFKPDNVLVGVDGRIRVADFGLARWSTSVPDVRALPAGELDRSH